MQREGVEKLSVDCDEFVGWTEVVRSKAERYVRVNTINLSAWNEITMKPFDLSSNLNQFEAVYRRG